MFKEAWKVFCRFCFLAGLLLSFAAVVELFRVFIFFYRIDPLWGWVFAAVTAAFFLGLVVYAKLLLSNYPRVLRPPYLPLLKEAGYKDLCRYSEYLMAYLARLAENAQLESDQVQAARSQIEAIGEALRAHPLKDDLRRTITETEEDVMAPLLLHLNDLSNKEVRRSVRDVMLGVTLSPYHSVDMVIVLYRNAAMVGRIAGIYASRPHSREQMLILRDVARVVVTVNFLYIGRNLLENLFANVPVIGRVVDDIGQGLGAGLFTSAAGHAAIDRCAAFRGWSKDEAADSLASQTKAFLKDVRDIFTRDVLPDLRGRIRSELPGEKIEEPAFWERLTNGVSTAVDATAGVVGHLVIKPAVAGTRGMMRAGGAVTRTKPADATMSPRGHRRRRRRRKSVKPLGLFGTLGQRIRYAFRGPRD